MLIFRYAKEGTLEIEGLMKIAATCDVTKEGVGGAKSFFEAKRMRSATSTVFWQSIRYSGHALKLTYKSLLYIATLSYD